MANRFDKYTTPADQTVEPTLANNRFVKYVEDTDKTEEQAQVESGEWLETDNFSTAMAFMQGVSLGWYDEYRVGITALAESAFGDVMIMFVIRTTIILVLCNTKLSLLSDYLGKASPDKFVWYDFTH